MTDWHDSALVDRWAGPEGEKRVDKVLAYIRHGKSLATTGVGTWEGRWDLRGLTVPGAHLIEQMKQRVKDTGEDRLRSLSRTKLSRIKLVGVDLSGANFSHSVLESSDVEDSVLNSARFDSASLRSCVFRRTQLRNAVFRGCFFHSRPGQPPNIFDRVDFDGADLRGSYHSRSRFVDCSFRRAKLTRVDFAASSFTRCVFTGLLSSVWFRGGYHIPDYERRYGRAEANQMDGVDFSEATLRGVMFTHGVDLSKAILPSTQDHVIIHDPDSAYHHARRVIGHTWSEPDRAVGLEVIHLLERPDRHGLVIDILNREELAEYTRSCRKAVARYLSIGDGAVLQGNRPDPDDRRLATAITGLLETPEEMRDMVEPAPTSSLWPAEPMRRLGVEHTPDQDRERTRWWWPFRKL